MANIGRTAWLMGRAVGAIALTIGFYLLAIGMALGLFYVPYAEWVYADRIDRLAIFCIIGGGAILWSIFPHHVPFVPPGPKLLPREQARLFERLNKLARAIGQRMPAEVYLVADLNAWVAQVDKQRGLRSQRVMGIGLPLLQVVTVSEFEAILAHEFGHYHGGDTRLGPWIYKTRLAIGRTIQNLAQASSAAGLIRFLQYPFIWYGHVFLRITFAISRAQELSADRLAAETIGAEPLQAGLRAIHRAAPVAAYYMNNEVLPVVRSGFAPPVTEGFDSFLRADWIVKAMDVNLESQLTSAEPPEMYDTHPPLVQRLAALERLPKGQVHDDAAAISLLDGVPSLESKLVSSWMPAGSTPLKPIEWRDTGVAVFLPSWRKMLNQSSKALEGIALEDLYHVASKLDPFARKLNLWQSGVPWPTVQQYASNVLGAALACALYAKGWTLNVAPGALWFSDGPNRLNPFDTVQRMRSGELKESEWNEMMTSFRLDPAMPLDSLKLPNVDRGKAN